MSAAPIIKWAGGKTRLLPRLRARMPARFNRYYEPFVGGAALFFDLSPQTARIGDVNEGLVTLYRAITTALDDVVRVILDHKARHSDLSYYYDVRDRWNDPTVRLAMTPAEVGGTFIYLNKTCYNGLWRENKRGGFNVPRGNYVDPPILDKLALVAARDALLRATIGHGPYQETTADAAAGDFVYFDPPYDPLSDTSNFTSYAASPFGKPQQRELSEHARALDSRGTFVMVSNNDTPYVRDLYQDFVIDTVPCGRSINSKADRRGKVDEVIITSRRR